jgi:alpha-glucosidase/alpha-D-xyloside xylohydrolase
MIGRRIPFIAFGLALAVLPAMLPAGPLKIAGTPFELAISQVSDRTVRFVLFPLDEQGKPRDLPASTVLVEFPATEKIRVRDLDQAGDVLIGNLKISCKADPPTLAVYTAGGKLVQEIVIDPADGSFTFHTQSPVYGLGEGRQQFDRRGYFYNFINGQNTLLATHGATVPVPFLIGIDGWAMFIHNPPPAPGNLSGSAATRDANIPWGQFDLRGENAGPPPSPRSPATSLTAPTAELPTRGRFIPRADTLSRTPIQIFVMRFEKPADALAEYVLLTGHPVMPPKWVMGYMQSHRSLADSQEPISVAQTFRDHQLPCDAVIYLGSEYTNHRNGLSGWNTGHGSLTFNPRIFDKPREMIDKLHSLNFKIILHKNAAPAGLFGASVNERSENPLHIGNYWATHNDLMRMGIDGWWPDDGDELPIENRLARLRLYYEGPLKDRPNERPWSLDRNGYAGAAKYGAWIWSGDVTSRWTTLANHVAVGLNFSMSVSPWWGTDIGGFVSSNEYTGELYTRWFQFAAFNPLFRSHGRNWHLHTPFGWNTGEVGPLESNPPPPESELHNAQVEPICKKYLELRYSLLPYNYTIMREACDTGLPPMRALCLNYADDPEAARLGDEYLWGPDILVAPVVAKGATSRSLYLPAGDWYDWWTGAKQAGKQWIDRPVDLATMPIYVKAGAIIPIDPIRHYTAEPVSAPTTLRIHTGADGSFTLYDDDGHTQGYLTGADPQTQWIKFTYIDATHTLAIDPDPRMITLPGGTRHFQIQITGSTTAGKEIEFKEQHLEIGL